MGWEGVATVPPNLLPIIIAPSFTCFEFHSGTQFFQFDNVLFYTMVALQKNGTDEMDEIRPCQIS